WRRPAADRIERRRIAKPGCARHEQGAQGDGISGLFRWRMETVCSRGGTATESIARDGEAPKKRGERLTRTRVGPHHHQHFLGKILVRESRKVQRLRQPAAARPDLRA